MQLYDDSRWRYCIYDLDARIVFKTYFKSSIFKSRIEAPPPTLLNVRGASERCQGEVLLDSP